MYDRTCSVNAGGNDVPPSKNRKVSRLFAMSNSKHSGIDTEPQCMHSTTQKVRIILKHGQHHVHYVDFNTGTCNIVWHIQKNSIQFALSSGVLASLLIVKR